MIEQARLERVASGLAPVTPGWFVVNAREAAWMNNDQTESCCIFESDDFVLRGRPDLTEYEKPGAGFVLRVLRLGRPTGFYHAESVQEDFLVLMGECILIIEDQERRLRSVGLRALPARHGAHVRRSRRRSVRTSLRREPRARRDVLAYLPALRCRFALRRECRARRELCRSKRAVATPLARRAPGNLE
jgi:hypothetical protein